MTAKQKRKIKKTWKWLVNEVILPITFLFILFSLIVAMFIVLFF